MTQIGASSGLTARQREVLELIGRGYTNRQIGERLGISLDGAKWHVSEVLARLDVRSRDEAADYWRVQNGLRPRLFRLAKALGAAFSWRLLGIGAASVAGAAAIGVALVVAIGGGDGGGSEGAASPGETPAPSPTPGASSTPAAPPSPTQVPSKQITGLFEGPLPTATADREATVNPSPAPTFDWDDESTVIFDRQTGELLALGPGMAASIAPSGAWAAWTSGLGPDSRAMVIDMASREMLDLGPATHVFVVNEETVAVDRDYSNRVFFDARTGAEVAINDLHRALAESWPTPAYGLEIQPFEQDEVRRQYDVLDARSGELLFAFEAAAARLIGEPSRRELLIATAPSPGGTTNLFVVDLASGTAAFVATIPFADQQWRGWGMTGNADVIAWTGAFCSPEGAFIETAGTWVLDRSSGGITHIEQTLLLNDSPEGWLGVGFSGVERLLDPDTFEYAFVSPQGWVGWSRDLRYASVGAVGGHGSLC